MEVHFLKESTGHAWTAIETFVKKQLGTEDLPCDRLRTLVQKTLRDLQKTTTASEKDSLLATLIDCDGLGEQLTKAGFRKASLLSSTFDFQESAPIQQVGY